jgi:hypothetical protein
MFRANLFRVNRSLRFQLPCKPPDHPIMRTEVHVENCHRPANVRYSPESRHSLPRPACPLCAKSGHSALRQRLRYSITSSAALRRPCGTTMPWDLFVPKADIGLRSPLIDESTTYRHQE